MRQRRTRIRGSYDPIVFQTERGSKGRRSTMPTRIDQIIKLIQEEASASPERGTQAAKIMHVLHTLHYHIAMLITALLRQEMTDAIKKGGE